MTLEREMADGVSGRRKAGMLILGFALPVILLLAAFASRGIMPFGERSILISDLSKQYVDFMAYYRQMLQQGNLGGLLYSLSKGLGGNFYGIFTYYLASPLNLILLLIPSIEWGIWALIVLRVGLSGLTMTAYLWCSQGRIKWDSSVFAAMYSMSGFMIAHMSNLLWMDGPVLLPLIMLGMERLLDEKKAGLFIASVALMAICNYYIAYMIGLFGVLYFIYACIIRFNKEQWKAAVGCLLRVGISAFLAIGIATVVLLPSFFSLLQGKSEGLGISLSGSGAFNLLGATQNLFIGRFTGLGETSVPYLYISVLGGLLVLGYFFVRGISARHKIAAAMVLITLFICLYNRTLNTIWHMFAKPEAFPYRFTFVIVFFAVTLAAQAWDRRRQLHPFFGCLCAVALLGVTLAREMYLGPVGAKGFWTTVLLLGISSVLLVPSGFWCKCSWRKRVFTAAACLAVCGDLCVNASLYIKWLDRSEGYILQGEYTAQGQTVQALKQQADSIADGFYRLQNLDQRSKNESLSFCYYSVSHFSSLYEQEASNAMEGMGFEPSFFGTDYSGTEPIRDALLGIRFLAAPEDYTTGYSRVGQSGELVLYENKNALPLMFAGNSQALRVQEEDSGRRAARFLEAASGQVGIVEKVPGALENACRDIQRQGASLIFPAGAGNQIKGKIVLKEGQTLFTTLPYDASWKILLDGAQVYPVRYMDGLMAIEASAGEHVFEMTYWPKGLTTGLCVSALSLATAVFWCLVALRRCRL